MACLNVYPHWNVLDCTKCHRTSFVTTTIRYYVFDFNCKLKFILQASSMYDIDINECESRDNLCRSDDIQNTIVNFNDKQSCIKVQSGGKLVNFRLILVQKL